MRRRHMSSETDSSHRFENIQLLALIGLRVVIGWHFLYEGLSKLLEPGWTSAGYLAESKWLLSGLFHWIIANPPVLETVDFLNIWGQIFIGLGLLLGLFNRTAAVAGIALMALYYIANPPLIGMASRVPTGGNTVIVDKNLVELFALSVLALFPTGKIVGLDRLIMFWRQRKQKVSESVPVEKVQKEESAPPPGPITLPRRELVRSLATVPILGGFAYAALRQRSFEERHLVAAAEGNVDTLTSATMKTFQFSSLKDLEGEIPKGKIGDLELSRIFLGGNLMGGWAHARDLIYVSKLVKSYHSDAKVFETFRIAEACGMNTILTNPILCRVIGDYWLREKGKIQFFSDCAYGDDIMTGIKMSIDGGAHSCYVQGGIADRLAAKDRLDEIGRAFDFIKQNGLPAGIGAHALDTVKKCVEAGIKPDYWVKTLHHCDYWSAGPEEEHDNIWCKNPPETIAYMESLEEPWIAFKTLAAGAIHPDVGFQYAFENGADFICVGMYDFQIVDDANIAARVLASNMNRRRPWRA
jgi:uncharacterized membrane protein YphA (DoxX/SURF4 family)